MLHGCLLLTDKWQTTGRKCWALKTCRYGIALYFLLLLGSVQATDFFSHSTQEQLQGVFSAALPLHRHLVSSGLAAGVFPAFDTFSRSRPRFAAQMYKRLFGKDRQWSAPKLSAWMLLESIFRYAGEVAVVEQMLFNNDVFPGLHAVMSAGLCHEMP